MQLADIVHTFKRYRTLQTHRITALPIVIMMPHSACNCRCIMCDIWKDNQNLKQLKEDDIRDLLVSFGKYGTRQVVMSGGEALLHPLFFDFCSILRNAGIKVSLLSTGLLLEKHAERIAASVNDVIVSLDGDEETHDLIRNIPGAFRKLRDGIQAIRAINANYTITGRTVIHRLNFRKWPAIIDAAKNIALDEISFLPADVSSHAFNREVMWTDTRQHEILLSENELEELNAVVESLIVNYKNEFASGFIAESPVKIRKIYSYYAAFYGRNEFPFKKCNAPWVSAVIEADGTVRPCFFHEAMGNIHDNSFDEIVNSEKAIEFRRELDMEKNSTCLKCVCYLNLPPRANPGAE
jgi:Fe-coproporphyrin III synthase